MKLPPKKRVIFNRFTQERHNGISDICEVSSRIKGHHIYNYNYIIGEQITCEVEDKNHHSKNVISVFSKENKMIGHVPETLAMKLTPLWKDGFILEITER